MVGAVAFSTRGQEIERNKSYIKNLNSLYSRLKCFTNGHLCDTEKIDQKRKKSPL